MQRLLTVAWAAAMLFACQVHAAACQNANAYAVPTCQPQLVQADTERWETSSSIDSGWKLVFGDEFDSTLDASAWNACTSGEGDVPKGCAYQGILSEFSGDRTHVNVQNGSLNIGATCNSKGKPIGGYASTYGKMAYTYGYTEARVKLERLIDGEFLLWSVAQAPETWPPEIDTVDFGPRDDTVTQGNWKSDGLMDAVVATRVTKTEWHTYCYDLRPGDLTFYVDGHLRQKFQLSDVPNVPIIFIATYAVVPEDFTSDWKGAVDCTKLPAAMNIDYVRIWQRPGMPGTTYMGPVPYTDIPAPPFLALLH